MPTPKREKSDNIIGNIMTSNSDNIMNTKAKIGETKIVDQNRFVTYIAKPIWRRWDILPWPPLHLAAWSKTIFAFQFEALVFPILVACLHLICVARLVFNDWQKNVCDYVLSDKIMFWLHL